MGWEVIAICDMETDHLGSEEREKLIKLLEENECYEISVAPNFQGWKMSGNKRVDYSLLERLPRFLGGKVFRLSANEYTEADGGYYYEKELEDELCGLERKPTSSYVMYAVKSTRKRWNFVQEILSK